MGGGGLSRVSKPLKEKIAGVDHLYDSVASRVSLLSGEMIWRVCVSLCVCECGV